MGIIDRQKNILDFTVSSLLKRKGKNAALVLVFSVLLFIFASVVFFTYALKEEAALLLKDAPELIIQKITAGRHDMIPAAYVRKIETIRGVSAVKGRLWGYYYDPVTGANYTVMVPEIGSPGPGSIVVGEGVARVRSAFAGDSMEFRTATGVTTEMQIHSLIGSHSSLISSDLVLMSERDFRSLFGIAVGCYTDLVLTVRNPRESRTVAVKIAQLLPDTRQILREEILRTYDAVFNWRGGILIVVSLGALLAFLILSWDKASGLSSEEKREIGILKAIGWETSDIILLKFWESAALSLTSFCIGVSLAYVHVFFTSAALFQPVLKGWAVLYPEFRVFPMIDFPQLAALFFITVVPYISATIIPSWRAATVDPDAVMR